MANSAPSTFLRYREKSAPSNPGIKRSALIAGDETSGRRMVERFSSVGEERSLSDAGGIVEHSRQSPWRKDSISRPREVLTPALTIGERTIRRRAIEGLFLPVRRRAQAMQRMDEHRQRCPAGTRPGRPPRRVLSPILQTWMSGERFVALRVFKRLVIVTI